MRVRWLVAAGLLTALVPAAPHLASAAEQSPARKVRQTCSGPAATTLAATGGVVVARVRLADRDRYIACGGPHGALLVDDDKGRGTPRRLRSVRVTIRGNVVRLRWRYNDGCNAGSGTTTVNVRSRHRTATGGITLVECGTPD